MERKINRELLYRESLKLFHEKGYSATSMRDIAKRLDIQPATLYNYIAAKHDILETFLFDMANQFHGGMKNIFLSSYKPLEKLKALISMNVQITSKNPYKVSLLVSGWKHLEEDKKREFLQNRSEYESMLKEIIKKGMQTGDFRMANLEITLQAILSSIRWMFTWYSSEATIPNPIELEKQMTDFILTGIQK